jgi:hypothetical protein
MVLKKDRKKEYLDIEDNDYWGEDNDSEDE